MLKQTLCCLTVFFLFLSATGLADDTAHKLSKKEAIELQERLHFAGFPPAEVEGKIDEHTLAAARVYKKQPSLPMAALRSVLLDLQREQGLSPWVSKQEHDALKEELENLEKRLELLTHAVKIESYDRSSQEERLKNTTREFIREYLLYLGSIGAIIIGAIGSISIAGFRRKLEDELSKKTIKDLKTHVDNIKNDQEKSHQLRVTELNKLRDDASLEGLQSGLHLGGSSTYFFWKLYDILEAKRQELGSQALSKSDTVLLETAKAVTIKLSDVYFNLLKEKLLDPDLKDDAKSQYNDNLANCIFYFANAESEKQLGLAKPEWGPVIDLVYNYLNGYEEKDRDNAWANYMDCVIYGLYRFGLRDSDTIKSMHLAIARYFDNGNDLQAQRKRYRGIDFTS